MTDFKTIRQRTYNLMNAGWEQKGINRFIDIALIVLIALNVAAVIIESIQEMHDTYGELFYIFEVFSVIVFTIEYLVRVWSIVESSDEKLKHSFYGRLRFMSSPMLLLDLAVILPFYLTFIIGLDTRFLRIVRLMRIFRLTRYSASMSLLVEVLRKEASKFGAALFVLLMLILLSAGVVYLAEREVQPEAFASIPHALWWSLVTMTTIGYGDVYPITLVGRLCTGVISILSMGMVALPAGILASGFSDALNKRNEQYQDLVDEVLEDDVIDDEEVLKLANMQKELGINKELAERILHKGRKSSSLKVTCDHCGHIIRVKRS